MLTTPASHPLEQFRLAAYQTLGPRKDSLFQPFPETTARARGRAWRHQVVERLLTVVATCRQQRRRLLDFLVAASEAALPGSLPPSLLPAP